MITLSHKQRQKAQHQTEQITRPIKEKKTYRNTKQNHRQIKAKTQKT